MDNLEKVEKIREKTGVSYEDAKEALEASNYDILDAIVYLEKNGKVKGPAVQVVTVEEKDKKERREKFKKTQEDYEKNCNKGVKEGFNSFFKWCGKVLEKSVKTSFVVERRHEEIITMPVLVLILFLIFLFWLIFPLMIVGLFFECRYKFDGASEVKVDLNAFCDKCADGAENIKKEFCNSEDKDNN
ncbi:MAG: UBA/TS-N domain protein [Lachnospiraceae bacterium]|nr:UBA/TS-N domain protein [Lachnospiraceae bacterium]